MSVVKFEHVGVAAIAEMRAPRAMSSAEIESRLESAMARAGLPPGLIYQLTGIAERRVWPPGVLASVPAAMAGRKALERSDVSRERIGVLVSTSVCKDYIEPSVASMVHRTLELGSHCLNFDVGNACLGFLNGVMIVGDMIERGSIEFGMIVDGESSLEVIEATIARLNEPGFPVEKMREQLATLTLGSGAAAMVLGRRELLNDGAPQVIGAVTEAATEHNDLCRGQRDWMETDAAMLLVRGVELGQRTFARAQAELGWSPGALDLVCAHQVSAVHMTRVAEALGLSMDRFLKIYHDHGNVGPASIPIALAKAVDQGRVGPGARVGLMGIGSGLNASMMEIRF
ncbi:3-oxoacyl-ACP synthase III [Lujinxingia litoralis]|uniref:3-oxoacyl-ACP synthase III n=1 Tax=Lujinxingia litoralis TaxID=2211119 RepID=A0A328CAH7_9DELT|nr:3-oxoacyl-ACP synthase III [Lujinxingia litoralis]RAL24004.1 3-oxoacyl-ACP synthase III [Lujinxingia litoralis]